MQTRQISLIFSNIHYGTSNLSFQASEQGQKTNNSFFHNIINPFEFSDYSSVEEDEIDPDLFYNKLYFHINTNENFNYMAERNYYFDILRRKLKTLVINNAFIFINGKIKNSDFKIRNIEGDIKREKKIEEERIFMDKTLGEIFSNKISIKNKTIQDKTNFNKDKIDKLRNSNDELKNIFDITFIQCLNHFMGKEPLELLNGMTTFEKIKFKDEVLKINLLNIGKKFEELMKNIKPRNGKRNKKNKFRFMK